MSKTYLPYDPDQQLLLPAGLQEWLTDDQLACFISDVVDQLDLSAITARYEQERRGAPPYHPRMMVKVLAFCQRAGLVKLGHVALDGTKVRANASKHKAMSYRRMKEKEEQLATEVAELLRRAQEVDEEEDRRYGQDKRGDELPEELAFREGRLEKIREAMAALEARPRRLQTGRGRRS